MQKNIPGASTAEDSISRVRVRPLSTPELSHLYDTTPRIFNQWMKKLKDKIGERMGHFYTVAQVRVIFDLLGWPEPKG